MQKVTVVAKLKAKEGLEEQVKSELLKLVDATRKERGCLNYDLHVSESDPGVFLFYENWVSKMALDNHFNSEHFLHLRSKASELFAEPSAIEIMKMVSDPE